MSELRGFFDAFWPEVSELKREEVEKYFALLIAENKVQNLTRITEPEDFFHSNVMDVKALLSSGFLRFPAMDVGSGGGVPGLLAAILGDGQWVLSDSEGRKADFLKRAVELLGLSDRVSVFYGRAEAYLSRHPEVQTLVFRAVGTVGKTLAWFQGCSTWNKAIFFKGPALEAELEDFEKSRGKKGPKFNVEGTIRYTSGPEAKKRVLISLVK